MTVRYLIDGFHDGVSGPLGWPKLFVTLSKDAKPPDGAVVWTQEERDAWERDPARQAEREAWEALRPQPTPFRPPRRIRSLAFLDRLPLERQAEIVAAARVMATKGQPLPDLLLTRLGAATEIDLDDPRVVQGVAAMRAAGLLTDAEAEALLSDPVPEEMP